MLGAITREHTPVSGCESTYLGTMRYFAVAAPWLAEGFDSWETLVGYGPNDQILDDAMRERFIDSHVIRARVSQVPLVGGYLTRCAMGWAGA